MEPHGHSSDNHFFIDLGVEWARRAPALPIVAGDSHAAGQMAAIVGDLTRLRDIIPGGRFDAPIVRMLANMVEDKLGKIQDMVDAVREMRWWPGRLTRRCVG